jgi:hypothetical protein
MLLQVRIFNRLVSSPTFLLESLGGCVVFVAFNRCVPCSAGRGSKDKGSKATEVPTTSRTVLLPNGIIDPMRKAVIGIRPTTERASERASE